MAASAKRKQEEKHLKMLREMTSLAPNRKCFDCDQRGPTYANMTVGSFVCTSCSGILRGLNPPHRVKSISMTTFTQQEIEFLQKHGNEVCKQIWLGLYDDRTSAIPDFREPQKVKEFLQEKYEKKRWYVPPEQAKVVASVHASISGSSASSTSSTPEVRPLKTLLGETAPTLHLSRNTPSQSPVVSRTQLTQQDRKFDLLSDLGGDIFAAPPSQSAGGANFANFAHFNSHPASQNANASADFANFDAFGSSAAAAAPSAAFPQAPQQATFQPAQTGGSSGQANANFANFDNFPKSCSADFASYGSSQTNCAGGGAKAEGFAVPADRYAALADLDNIFSSVKPDQGRQLSSQTLSIVRCQMFVFVHPVGPSTNPFVATAVPQAAVPTNPFQTNGRAVAGAASFGPGSMSMPAGFGNAAAYNLPTSFSGSFQQAFPSQGFPQQQPYPQQPNGGGFAAFGGQGKTVVAPFGQNMASAGVTNNPFLVSCNIVSCICISLNLIYISKSLNCVKSFCFFKLKASKMACVIL
uniref:Arf-GAP domain-containing protein n=1 Tax=Pygocentrus nattereri TaxID=42514 RepID=A0AAR2LK12_PYGNA